MPARNFTVQTSCCCSSFPAKLAALSARRAFRQSVLHLRITPIRGTCSKVVSASLIAAIPCQMFQNDDRHLAVNLLDLLSWRNWTSVCSCNRRAVGDRALGRPTPCAASDKEPYRSRHFGFLIAAKALTMVRSRAFGRTGRHGPHPCCNPQ